MSTDSPRDSTMNIGLADGSVPSRYWIFEGTGVLLSSGVVCNGLHSEIELGAGLFQFDYLLLALLKPHFEF